MNIVSTLKWADENGPHEEKVATEFERGNDSTTVSFYAHDEPIAIRFILSGWFSGDPLYHVITEWGDYEDCTHELLRLSEICTRYCIKPEELNSQNHTL